MKSLAKVFNGASAVFGIIPGIAILITNVGVPPNSSKELFGGVIEALGVLTLTALWVNKNWVETQSLTNFNRLLLASILLFLASLFSYLFIYGLLVEEVPNSESLYFPFWPRGELLDGLNSYSGNRGDLIREWGRDDVNKIINSSSKTSLLLTTLLLLFIYQLVFVSLTFSFGLLGIRISKPGIRG